MQGRSGMYVKNSREFKEKIEDWRVERNEILVSYDVKNRYPSIPMNKALELVEKLLKENKILEDTTKHECLVRNGAAEMDVRLDLL